MRERIPGNLLVEIRCARQRRGRSCGEMMGAFSETCWGVEFYLPITTPAREIAEYAGMDLGGHYHLPRRFEKQKTSWADWDLDIISDELILICRRCRIDVREDDTERFWSALVEALAKGRRVVVPYEVPDKFVRPT